MRFIFLPLAVLENNELDVKDQIVLAHIVAHYNVESKNAFIRVDTLAKECKLDKTFVCASKHRLVKQGLLVVSTETGSMCHHYYLPWHPCSAENKVPTFKVDFDVLACKTKTKIICFGICAAQNPKIKINKNEIATKYQLSLRTVDRALKELNEKKIISSVDNKCSKETIYNIRFLCRDVVPYNDVPKHLHPKKNYDKTRKASTTIGGTILSYDELQSNQVTVSDITTKQLDVREKSQKEKLRELVDEILPQAFVGNELGKNEDVFRLLVKVIKDLFSSPYDFKDLNISAEEMRRLIVDEIEPSLCYYVIKTFLHTTEEIYNPYGYIRRLFAGALVNYYPQIALNSNRRLDNIADN